MATIALKATGPGSCRVTVAGDVDVVTAPEVRAALREAVSTHQRVDLGCSGLTVVAGCAGGRRPRGEGHRHMRIQQSRHPAAAPLLTLPRTAEAD